MHFQIFVWSSVGRVGKRVNVGYGPSRAIVAANVVGINVPGPPQMINLERLGDFPSATQMANL